MLNAALADQPLAVAAIAVAWWVSGFAVAGILARRGHSLRHVGALGLVLGPLLVGLAVANLQWKERFARPVVVREAGRLGGSERVLVAVLGDPSSVADALPVLRSAGERLGSVDIACPVTFDRADADHQTDQLDSHDAVDALEQAALFLDEFRPGLVMVPGRSSDAVVRYVQAEAPDMVVVAGDDDVQSALSRDHRLRTVTMVLGSDPPGD